MEPQHLYGAVEPDDPLTVENATHAVALQAASTFREPYLVTNLPTAPATFVHSQIPDRPLGTASWWPRQCMFMQAEEGICAPSGQ